MALIGGSGVLGPGQSQYFDAALQSGIRYSVYVTPADPSVDFNLAVYDEKGNLVAYDTDPKNDAFCSIAPLWTGPFRLVVTSARGLSTYNIRVEA